MRYYLSDLEKLGCHFHCKRVEKKIGYLLLYGTLFVGTSNYPALLKTDVKGKNSFIFDIMGMDEADAQHNMHEFEKYIRNCMTYNVNNIRKSIYRSNLRHYAIFLICFLIGLLLLFVDSHNASFFLLTGVIILLSFIFFKYPKNM